MKRTRRTPKTSLKSFKGTRDLTLQKYDMTTGSPQIATLYGDFTFSDLQKLFKDGYEIMTDWDKCKQLTPKNSKGCEQDVRKAIQAGNEAGRSKKAVL